MFKGLFKKLRCVFGRSSSRGNDAKAPHFDGVVVSTKAPSNDEIQERVFIKVVYKGKPYWCLFKCPCGCRRVISLSLQENHEPHWELKVTESGRPSLFPSVWQNTGCLSHFWIDGGSVLWCGNSGMKPWLAEPDFYSDPKDKTRGRG
ncbi:DUF6527 family protein [Salinimicrobium sp. CAU 1759]